MQTYSKNVILNNFKNSGNKDVRNLKYTRRAYVNEAIESLLYPITYFVMEQTKNTKDKKLVIFLQVYDGIHNFTVSTIGAHPNDYLVTAAQMDFAFKRQRKNLTTLAYSIINTNIETTNNSKDFSDIFSLLDTIPSPIKDYKINPEFKKYQTNPKAYNSPKPIGKIPEDYFE